MNILDFFVFSPNPIALSFVLCTLINLFFVIYLIQKKNSNITVYWFVLYAIITAIADLADAFLSMSHNIQSFSFWLGVADFGSIIPAPLLFAFGLSLANKNYYLKKLWVILPSTIIFFIMIYLIIKTDTVYSHNMRDALLTPWGLEPKSGIGIIFVGLYFLITELIILITLFVSYFTNKDIIRKKQIKIMMFSFVFIIFFIIFTKGFIPQFFHLPVFPSDIYLQIILVATSVYVLSKYGFNAFNIDSVSEKLLQLIPSSVVILDQNSSIQLSNPSAETLFHLSKEKLIGTPLKNYFISPSEYDTFTNLILIPLQQNSKTITKLDLAHISSTDGKPLAVDVQATRLKDTENTSGGILVIFTNIQEVLDQASQLEARLKEIQKQKADLERINKTMLNRELIMIQLKKENEELKKKIEKIS